MKRKYPFALVSRSGIVLSIFLLSVGSAIYTESNAQEARQTSPNQGLEQRLQEQVGVEANRIFSRTMTLFNILLATLALLLAVAIAALWLLRRL
jgi:hypothetical protein